MGQKARPDPDVPMLKAKGKTVSDPIAAVLLREAKGKTSMSSGYVVRYRVGAELLVILAVRHHKEAGF